MSPVFSALLPLIWMGATAAQAAVPPALLAIEKKYQTEGQLQAQIEQVTENASFKTVKKGRGRIWIKRPGQVRWEMDTPDPVVLVSDGKTTWYYTPPFDDGEQGQLIEKPAAATRNELTTALLAGEFSRSKNLTITGVGRGQFKIVPKKGTAGSVKQAVLEINSDDNTIRRMEILHLDGNRVEITLKDLRFGKAVQLKDDTFKFTAPANTQRMTE